LKQVAKTVRKLMSGGPGAVKILIDKILCKFDENRTAIRSFLNGINAKNVNKKFSHFGIFVGKLLKVLGSKN